MVQTSLDPHSTTVETQEMDIAILGGGPAGLSAALAFLAIQPTLRVKVYEQAERLQPVGAAVTLAANGLNALKAIKPAAYEKVFETSTKLKGIINYGAGGQVISDMDFSAMPSPPCAITWFHLQQILSEHLPEGVLQFGYKFKGIKENDENGANVEFEGCPAVHARLVIGADGNMSEVRRALFQEPRPDYSGIAVWRFTVDKPTGWKEKDDSLASWAVDGKLVAVRTMGPILTVTLLGAWPEDRLHELYRTRYYGPDEPQGKGAAATKLDRLIPMLEGFPQHIVDMFQSSDPANILEHGVYNRNPGNSWGAHSVTLLGDAAHVLPPNLGQGTSMAFEDAYYLAVKVSEYGVTPEALRHYEAVRVDRVSKVWEASQNSVKNFYHDKKDGSHPLAANKSESNLMDELLAVKFESLVSMMIAQQ